MSRLVALLQVGGVILLGLAALTVSVGLGLAAFGAGALLFGLALEHS